MAKLCTIVETTFKWLDAKFNNDKFVLKNMFNCDSLTPKIQCVFFTKLCNFWHNWKNQFKEVWEFKEVTVGSLTLKVWGESKFPKLSKSVIKCNLEA